jgi:opacity protein-like surface antigen
MKKVLSVMAVSAFVLTAGVALAGGPGKKMGPGCPEACQQQIDDLNSSQAQQNEQLGAHSKQLQNHEGRITDLEKAFADSWYVRLGAGASWLSADAELGFADNDLDFDAGWTGRIAFGREFAMYQALGKFRAELEFGYQTNDADLEASRIGDFLQQNGRDLSVDTYTFMLNGYYELPVADAFSVYGMAGVGVAHMSPDGQIWNGAGWVDVDSMADGRTAFAYKAGLGVTYNFTDQVAGDLGYEYLGVADTGVLSDINSSNVVASVRFKF